jgi:hypothetical protein
VCARAFCEAKNVISTLWHLRRPGFNIFPGGLNFCPIINSLELAYIEHFLWRFCVSINLLNQMHLIEKRINFVLEWESEGVTLGKEALFRYEFQLPLGAFFHERLPSGLYSNDVLRRSMPTPPRIPKAVAPLLSMKHHDTTAIREGRWFQNEGIGKVREVDVGSRTKSLIDLGDREASLGQQPRNLQFVYTRVVRVEPMKSRVHEIVPGSSFPHHAWQSLRAIATEQR